MNTPTVETSRERTIAAEAPKETPPSEPWFSPAKIIVQGSLFLACLALLVWCLARVFAPKNRENLRRLLDATPTQLAELLGLSCLVVLLSGAAFRQALMPVRKLPMLEVQSVNVIAGLLALVPFKLSVVFRVVMHNRRDGLPVLTIGAWFAAVGAVMGSVLGPMMLVSLWRGKVDAVWFVTSLSGVAVCLALLITVAMYFATERGWARVQRIWAFVPMPGFVRRSTLLDRAHEGVRMLAHPGAVLTCAGLRLTDLAVQAARFIVASAIVGEALPADQAVLAGSTYFLIGAFAPAGQLGAREAGTTGFMSQLFPSHDLDRIMTAVVAISAAEVVVLLAGSAIALIVLRPDRMIRGKRRGT